MKHCYSFVLLALCTAFGGCALPHNSPGPHGDRIRPVVARRMNNLPPAAMLMHPGPGVDGPGPGVFMTSAPGAGMGLTGLTSQVAFIGLDGMHVNWDVGAPGMFDSEPLIVPGRYNFGQGGIYRLRLTNIPGRPGVELYPTLEIAPATPRTEAYLAHNAIPFQITDEDLDQVLGITGNFVTKVIYLPDPEFQELALAGVETLVSSRLDPGVDAVVEADRKGSILAIIRIGNKDLQVAGAGDSAMQAGFSMAGGASMGLPSGAMGGGACSDCGPGGAGGGGGGGVNPFVAGVTTPQYGMPYVGTPIGLPGPPHIPLGVPAGLQQHVMRNHTKYHIPGPVEKVAIDVKQKPGLSYPKPVDHVHITERSYVPPIGFHQPFADHHHHVGTLGNAGHASQTGAECVDGECDPYEAH